MEQPQTGTAPEPEPEAEPAAVVSEASNEVEQVEAAPDHDQVAEAETGADSGDLIVDAGVTVAPEEPTEEHESANLDPKIAEGDGLPG